MGRLGTAMAEPISDQALDELIALARELSIAPSVALAMACARSLAKDGVKDGAPWGAIL